MSATARHSNRPPPGIVAPTGGRGKISLACDVVVVGSGAGGATAAAVLAEHDLEVLVVEEGGYFDTADYSASMVEMFARLTRNGGATVIMGRRPVVYFEGRCVGGTTTVNGGMCWRTPEKILDRWAREMGLVDLQPDRLAPRFEEVERTINARHQDPGSEGTTNERFRLGAEIKGWKLSRNRRNQVHCVGSNDCVSGCPSGAKQSMLYSWLPRLWAEDGQVHTHLRVDRVLIERGEARGVTGVVVDEHGRSTGRRFEVRARAVVLAGGAVQTPLLLLRNQLGASSSLSGRHVGRHFTIHPNVKVAALYGDDHDALRGAHQAYQCTEFVDEGILLAPGSLPPAAASLVFGGFGPGLARKMQDYRRLATGGVLVEDSSSGRVSLGAFGRPRVRYDVTDLDQARFIRGVALSAELHFAAGAREIYTPFHSFPVIRSPDDIRKLLDRAPPVRDTEYFTAHLMGTCRMHGNARQGVVGPDGQMWDVGRLYIADASVMPTPIGVNPQVTIMALAHHVGQRIAETLGHA